MTDRTYGVVIGIVSDLEDPAGEGRIKVRFPWLTDDDAYQSGWAPIARPMAGKERGFYYMPELDDEALVAFEHGDYAHPFVLGFLHNGVDLPPDDGIDKSVRRLRTVCGHVLEFDDRSGEEKILLKTKGGRLLEISDKDSKITLDSTKDNKIIIDDNSGKITAQVMSGSKVVIDSTSVVSTTPGGAKISLSDSSVEVNAPAASLTVTCLSATVSASSSCTVNSPTMTVSGGSVTFSCGMATFSGVVQCSTLIATTVVSSTYTPGVGNLI